MGRDGRQPLSLSERADNAEESIKCPMCGTMILLGYDEDDEVVTCPSVKDRLPPLKNTSYILPMKIIEPR